MNQDILKSQQKALSFSAASLMSVGMLTGILVAAAITKQVPANGHSMLAAHLNGLMGCFWLLGYAWTLPMLSYSPKMCQNIGKMINISVWANWFFTLVKAFWNVSGLEYSSDFKNNLIAGSLQLFVVLPGLIASLAWAWGLKPDKKNTQG